MSTIAIGKRTCRRSDHTMCKWIHAVLMVVVSGAGAAFAATPGVTEDAEVELLTDRWAPCGPHYNKLVSPDGPKIVIFGNDGKMLSSFEGKDIDVFESGGRLFMCRPSVDKKAAAEVALLNKEGRPECKYVSDLCSVRRVVMASAMNRVLLVGSDSESTHEDGQGSDIRMCVLDSGKSVAGKLQLSGKPEDVLLCHNDWKQTWRIHRVSGGEDVYWVASAYDDALTKQIDVRLWKGDAIGASPEEGPLAWCVDAGSVYFVRSLDRKNDKQARYMMTILDVRANSVREFELPDLGDYPVKHLVKHGDKLILDVGLDVFAFSVRTGAVVLKPLWTSGVSARETPAPALCEDGPGLLASAIPGSVLDGKRSAAKTRVLVRRLASGRLLHNVQVNVPEPYYIKWTEDGTLLVFGREAVARLRFGAKEGPDKKESDKKPEF